MGVVCAARRAPKRRYSAKLRKAYDDYVESTLLFLHFSCCPLVIGSYCNDT
jgi:hypothetical protein